MRVSATLFVCAALVGCGLGCGDKKQDRAAAPPVEAPPDAVPDGPQPRPMHPLGKVALSFEPSAEEQAALEGLLESARTTGVTNDQLRNPANARPFLYLAGKHGDDAALVAEALRGMARTFTADPKRQAALRPIDDDYRAVVRFNLGVDVAAVAGRAVEAAAPILSEAEPDPTVVAALASMIGDQTDPAAQYAALSAVPRMREPFGSEAMVAAHEMALSSAATYVLSRAADNVGRYRDGDRRAALFTRVSELAAHTDEGVRGRAAAAMAQLGRTDAERAAAVTKLKTLLGDSSAFVRSVSAYELGRLGRFDAVATLMTMLDDQTVNRYDIRGFTSLDGSAGWEHHDGSAWSRVDDAVLAALVQLTFRQTDLRFERPAVRADDVEGGIARGRDAARVWYQKHRAAIEARAAEQSS